MNLIPDIQTENAISIFLYIVEWTGPLFWGMIFFIVVGWFTRLTLEIVRGALRMYYTDRASSVKLLGSVFVFGATLEPDKQKLRFYGFAFGGTLVGITRGPSK